MLPDAAIRRELMAAPVHSLFIVLPGHADWDDGHASPSDAPMLVAYVGGMVSYAVISGRAMRAGASLRSMSVPDACASNDARCALVHDPASRAEGAVPSCRIVARSSKRSTSLTSWAASRSTSATTWRRHKMANGGRVPATASGSAVVANRKISRSQNSAWASTGQNPRPRFVQFHQPRPGEAIHDSHNLKRGQLSASFRERAAFVPGCSTVEERGAGLSTKGSI